jgi:hypothetical protein
MPFSLFHPTLFGPWWYSNSFMKINAASGLGLGRNRTSQTGWVVINSTIRLAARMTKAPREGPFTRSGLQQ